MEEILFINACVRENSRTKRIADHVLKKLEGKGYIERVRSIEDERNLIVRVTKEGIALKDRALKVPGNIACCVCLEPEEAQELYRLLYKILGGMQ